ncbi:hypothetical protein HELRODRAFT_175073 [Helobdella robusta]|uniref:Uncharacterized protein n=1 Tax=Helobdella robusta TaxID=6412 RepID=T1F8T5_HELRO|nr:hypothetical protein HELRODRAFT_175073 [Helobdella robusta]ESO01046.1 hypothetical protein HELRODRAFT_175073 [Helobdella robusta]
MGAIKGFWSFHAEGKNGKFNNQWKDCRKKRSRSTTINFRESEVNEVTIGKEIVVELLRNHELNGLAELVLYFNCRLAGSSQGNSDRKCCVSSTIGSMYRKFNSSEASRELSRQ